VRPRPGKLEIVRVSRTFIAAGFPRRTSGQGNPTYVPYVTCSHRRRSSVKFRRGGTKFLPEKYVLKISKMPEFYMILARKIIKIPNFYDICPKNLHNSLISHDFCPKNARILVIIARKIFFSRILGGRMPPCPPFPMPMHAAPLYVKDDSSSQSR